MISRSTIYIVYFSLTKPQRPKLRMFNIGRNVSPETTFEYSRYHRRYLQATTYTHPNIWANAQIEVLEAFDYRTLNRRVGYLNVVYWSTRCRSVCLFLAKLFPSKSSEFTNNLDKRNLKPNSIRISFWNLHSRLGAVLVRDSQQTCGNRQGPTRDNNLRYDRRVSPSFHVD